LYTGPQALTSKLNITDQTTIDSARRAAGAGWRGLELDELDDELEFDEELLLDEELLDSGVPPPLDDEVDSLPQAKSPKVTMDTVASLVLSLVAVRIRDKNIIPTFTVRSPKEYL
jgi:hypothetical protein